MNLPPLFKKNIIYAILFLLFLTFTSARQVKKTPLPLASVHIVDRNGFSETVSAKERLKQIQQTDFLTPQPYQKVLRIYARDSKGNLRSIVTSYHSNGNPKQFLEILNGRAFGNYWEWHENGVLRISSKVIGGDADITQAAERSRLFDGTCRVWDEKGRLTAEIPYSQGILQGESIHFHESGKIWKRIPYVNGQAQGIMEIHKAEGGLLQQTTYVQNNKHGTSTRFWDANRIASREEYNQGRLETGEYFDVEGKLVSVIDGGAGFRVTFGKDSINELQEYKSGILDGMVKVFTARGYLKHSYHIKNSIKHGEEIEYYEQASLIGIKSCENTSPHPKISFNWSEGQISGPVKTWYLNGQQESRREMANNKKIGLATVWYKDGNLMMIEEYDQNKLIRGDYFRREEKIPVTQVIAGSGTATIFDAEGRFLRKTNYTNGKPDE
jgi:antitoxin component YwqK of YwqJK toxin-antitoxin module